MIWKTKTPVSLVEINAQVAHSCAMQIARKIKRKLNYTLSRTDDDMSELDSDILTALSS